MGTVGTALLVTGAALAPTVAESTSPVLAIGASSSVMNVAMRSRCRRASDCPVQPHRCGSHGRGALMRTANELRVLFSVDLSPPARRSGYGRRESSTLGGPHGHARVDRSPAARWH